MSLQTYRYTEQNFPFLNENAKTITPQDSSDRNVAKFERFKSCPTLKHRYFIPYEIANIFSLRFTPQKTYRNITELMKPYFTSLSFESRNHTFLQHGESLFSR